jgi:hypothetical protein
MSMPLTKGARRVVQREISRGLLTPSWAMVAGECEERVKSKRN